MTQETVSQVTSGKALEYAVGKNLAELGVGVLVDSNEQKKVRQAYYRNSLEDRNWLDKRAKKGALFIQEHEQLFDATSWNITFQPDRVGQQGDVRDIVVLSSHNQRMIGISVKRNNEAVKHSRLSETINFGEIWQLGKPCSSTYIDSIRPIFARLRQYQVEGKKWGDISDKEESVYKPIMEAFRTEIHEICSEKGAFACKALVRYLLGTHDCYKLIAEDNSVKIQVFNIHNTLNAGARIKLPSKLVGYEFKTSSNNTIELIFNQGWQFTFRIHSATKNVEPSLKLDIQLLGVPSKLYTHHLTV